MKRVAIGASKRPVSDHVQLIGKCDPNEVIRVSIYARRNTQPPAQVLRALDALSAELPVNRRYLTADEFNQVFGAEAGDLENIAAWARSCHLTVLDTSVPRRRVSVEGRIEDLERAFGVALHDYEHREYGRFRGRSQEIYVPEGLSSVIEGVFGLDTRQIGQPRRRTSKASADCLETDVSDQFPGSFALRDNARLYDYPSA